MSIMQYLTDSSYVIKQSVKIIYDSKKSIWYILYCLMIIVIAI